jgi:hypothetical protein
VQQDSIAISITFKILEIVVDKCDGLSNFINNLFTRRRSVLCSLSLRSASGSCTHQLLCAITIHDGATCRNQAH